MSLPVTLRVDGSERARDERLAGVIDLGSNSWRFVAHRYTPCGAWRRIAQLQAPVRIAGGLAATGWLAPERVARALEALGTFARYGRSLDIEADAMSVVATSALRDAGNGDEAIARAPALTGLEIRSLTAEQRSDAARGPTVASGTAHDGGLMPIRGDGA